MWESVIPRGHGHPVTSGQAAGGGWPHKWCNKECGVAHIQVAPHHVEQKAGSTKQR